MGLRRFVARQVENALRIPTARLCRAPLGITRGPTESGSIRAGLPTKNYHEVLNSLSDATPGDEPAISYWSRGALYGSALADKSCRFAYSGTQNHRREKGWG